MRALQIGTIELRSGQVSTLEVGRNDGSSTAIRLAQVSPLEIGIFQMGLASTGMTEGCSPPNPLT